MDLLTRTLRDLQRLLAPDALFSLAVLTVLLTLEIVGRQQTATDLHDLCAVMILFSVGWVTVQKHRLNPLGWVAYLGEVLGRVRNFLGSYLHIEIGVDLRGSPPLPRRLPDAAMAIMVGSAVLLFPLLLFAPAIPLGMRAVAIHVFYLGYLAFLVVLWLLLLGAMLMAIIIPTALIHDAFVNRSVAAPARLRRLEGTALVAYFGMLVLGALLLPPWVPLVICLLALSTNLLTITLPANPDVKFVWRYRDAASKIYCIPWGTWVTCEFTLLTLVTLDLVLLSSGSILLGGDSVPAAAPLAVVAEAEPGPAVAAVRRKPAVAEIMPITTSLGLTLAWLAPGALAALVLQTVLGRARDPARACRPVLHIAGACSPAARQALTAELGGRGWQLAKPGSAADALDVCVEVVDQLDGRRDKPTWPLRVTIDQLVNEDVLARLARRNEIQLRRRLIGGLERLFKMAASRKFRRGTGVWIAPHLWFIPGMSRDAPEDEWDLERGTVLSGIIGAPYHRILPRSVRHHAYVLLRALQIDLIFVEDSVSFRRFCRVLRMMFEHYDVFGGRRRIDEIHFQGLPGIRVMIHDYQLDEPFRSEVYPEPEYESLGRARLLHVFRDRGGQEDPLEAPFDFTHLPVPSLAR